MKIPRTLRWLGIVCSAAAVGCAEPVRADAMHERLLRALAETDGDGIARPAELTQEEIEGLEALGYVH